MNYILHLSLVLYSFWWCCCFHCCWLCCWFCFFFWCRCFCSYWRIITKSNSFQNWENSLDGLKRQVISLHSIKLLNLVCFWSTLLKIGLVLGNWTISIIQKNSPNSKIYSNHENWSKLWKISSNEQANKNTQRRLSYQTGRDNRNSDGRLKYQTDQANYISQGR